MKSIATKSNFVFILIFNFPFFIFNSSFSQAPTVQDCLGAIPICQDVYVELNSYSGDGNYHNEIYNPAGDCTQDCPGSCLDGEQNSVWYIFTVQHDGFLRFTIDPAGNDDYDWAVYDLTEYGCADIYSYYSQMQKSCNAYSQPPDGNTGISTANGGTTDCNHCGSAGSSLWNADLFVIKGRTFVLVVENWSGTNSGFTLDFSSSTASINDNKPPELDTVLTNVINCGAMEIMVGFSEKVMCESVDASDFLFTGPGGPITILDVQGETCMLGGEMEKWYTLFLDRPVNSNGDYFLQLVPENDVYDGCNNLAIGDSIVFYLDTGAPWLNDSDVVITAADYGINNGSITGLVVSGNEPLTYLWYDHYNDTVGTGLELHDVYSGDYYFVVTDANGCETLAGPYFVDLVEDLQEVTYGNAGTICVFPNPNHGKFTIQLSKHITAISVINMLGNELVSFAKEEIISGELQLDLTPNGPGVYLLKVTLDSGRVVTRFVQIL
jgi:hypothetical protein